MKRFLPNLKFSLQSALGFTMIELLIVIAILGILAVAVLSAINPVEQISRGRDTGSRSDAEQLLSAIDRFNAFQGYYPWQTAVGATGRAVLWRQIAAAWVDAGSTCPVYEKLSQATTGGCTGTDELKVTFFTKIFSANYNPLFITNRGQQGDSTYVCFVPVSKAFLTEAATRCIDAAGTGLPSDVEASARTAICSDTATPAQMICLP